MGALSSRPEISVSSVDKETLDYCYNKIQRLSKKGTLLLMAENGQYSLSIIYPDGKHKNIVNKELCKCIEGL